MSISKESVQRSGKAGDLTLNYYEAGEPTDVGGGLPLVMLHGGGPGASAWSNFGSALPGFAGHFRTLLVDQPGFGASDKPEVVGNYYRFAAVRIARASSDIDAAWALLVNNIREEQAHVAKGEKIPLGLRLKVRRDQVLGTQRAIDAIDSLFEASGGRALAQGTYLQRAWRDAHAGRVHAANDPERALQMYGAHEFGHKVDPGMY